MSTAAQAKPTTAKGSQPRTARRGSSPLAGRSEALAKPVANKAGWNDLDIRAVDTIRTLAADAVQKTGNGHPGTAMSLAPVAYLLFQNVMTHDPADSTWLGRDRFVLSCGHSSLTLYLQLFLSGYGLELHDIESLRTWGSLTPGHPEVHHTNGVEITTGPLGSGLASSVGMAMAQRRQRGLLDPDAKPGTSPFDHHVWVLASDGDMMEGVASEASSLAGHQELGNLTVIYDANQISIEDDTNVSFSEDVAARYAAYGWEIIDVDWRQSNDPAGTPGYTENVDELLTALEASKRSTNKPTLIRLHTVIAWPAPTKKGTGKAHGSALGVPEIEGLKDLLGFDPKKTFQVERPVLTHARKVKARGAAAHKEWNKRYTAWRKANPERAALLDRLVAEKLPDGLTRAVPTFPTDMDKGVATRAASGKILTALAPVMPELWGGSADLAESNNTTMEGEPSFLPTDRQTHEWSGGPYGRTLHFGIRENAMGMILNGIALEGLTRPYGGGFLIFSDYMRPAVRLASLQELPVTFVWTHDSIGLGEDGPTHQPIEHLASLRAMPGLDVVRPCDANETAAAWLAILKNRRPAALILSRQALPTLDRQVVAKASNLEKGAYVLIDGGADGTQTPDVILIATGSEVQLALKARETLEKAGTKTRVVSMPSREYFERQSAGYRAKVLPPQIRARVSVEAGVAQGWHDLVGDAGRCVSIEHFGASADGALLMEKFGFTPRAVVKAAKDSLKAARSSATQVPDVLATAPRGPQTSRTDKAPTKRPAAKASASGK